MPSDYFKVRVRAQAKGLVTESSIHDVKVKDKSKQTDDDSEKFRNSRAIECQPFDNNDDDFVNFMFKLITRPYKVEFPG